MADPISALPVEIFEFQAVPIRMEHPVEITLKKLCYRDTAFKPRDIFDTAVVLHKYGTILRDQLHLAAKSKTALLGRISSIPQAYFETAMQELDVRPEWTWILPDARQQVLDLVNTIPAPVASPAPRG